MFSKALFSKTEVINIKTGKRYEVLEFDERDNYRFFSGIIKLANKNFKRNQIEELVIDNILMDFDFLKDGFHNVNYNLNTIALMTDDSIIYAYKLSLKIQFEEINKDLFRRKYYIIGEKDGIRLKLIKATLPLYQDVIFEKL